MRNHKILALVGLLVGLATLIKPVPIEAQDWYSDYHFAKIHILTSNLTADNLTYITINGNSGHIYNVTIVHWANKPFIMAAFEDIKDANYFAVDFIDNGQDILESALNSYENNLGEVTVQNKYFVGKANTMIVIKGYDETSATISGTLWEYTTDGLVYGFAVLKAVRYSTYNVTINITDMTTGNTILSLHHTGTNPAWADGNWITTDDLKCHYEETTGNGGNDEWSWATMFYSSTITWITQPEIVKALQCITWEEFDELRTSGATTPGTPTPSLSITLTVTPTLATWGDSVTLVASVKMGEGVVANKMVSFYRKSGSEWISIGADETNEDGEASIVYTLPEGSGFAAITFKAIITGEDIADVCTIAVKPRIQESENWWAQVLELLTLDTGEIGIFQLTALAITVLGALGVIIRVIRKYAIILLIIGLILVIFGFI